MSNRHVGLVLLIGITLAVDLSVAAPSFAQAPRADVTASIGWFRVDASGHRYAPGHGGITTKGTGVAQDQYGPEFGVTPAWQVSGGYYWTRRLKSEIEVGWNGTRTDVYDTDPPCPIVGSVIRCDLVGAPSVFLTHNYQMFRASLAQMIQFRSTTGFRPYLGAGAGVYADLEHDGRLTCSTNRPCRGEGAIDGPSSGHTATRAFATLGFKAGRRVFFVSGLKIGKPEGWSLRIGIGAGG